MNKFIFTLFILLSMFPNLQSMQGATRDLLEAIENGRLTQETLDSLIDEFSDIHFDDDLPLRRAARLGSQADVELLLAAGGNIHVLDGDVLVAAVKSGDENTVNVVLEWSKQEGMGLFCASLIHVLRKEVSYYCAQNQYHYCSIITLLDNYLNYIIQNLRPVDALLWSALCNEQYWNLIDGYLQAGADITLNGLSLSHAILVQNKELVGLLLRYVEQELLSVSIFSNCIHLLKDTKTSDEIFTLFFEYAGNYEGNRDFDVNFELLRAIRCCNRKALDRWIILGADLHYNRDLVLKYAISRKYVKAVDLFLSYTISGNTLVDLSTINKFIDRCYEDGLIDIMDVLKTYRDRILTIKGPER